MTKIMTPETGAPEKFTDAEAAVDRLEQLYVQATEFLCASFSEALTKGAPVDYPSKIDTENGPVTVFDPGYPLHWRVADDSK